MDGVLDYLLKPNARRAIKTFDIGARVKAYSISVDEFREYTVTAIWKSGRRKLYQLEGAKPGNPGHGPILLPATMIEPARTN